jgi:5-oxoprolinase (ATP-hydrolysing) subunit A
MRSAFFNKENMTRIPKLFRTTGSRNYQTSLSLSMFRRFSIDINCDMGEGMGNDAQLMPCISSANIACGYHAGDEDTMRNTLALCKQYGVNAGAHPAFADRKNFGRIEMKLTPDAIYELVTAQLRILKRIADSMQINIAHVKPHGALYNLSAKDAATAAAIAQAVLDIDPGCILFGLSGSVSIQEANRIGLKTMNEAFADRTYQDDGSLTPRSQPQALITDVNRMLRQAEQMITEQSVTTVSGKIIPMKADTVCIHGDGALAVEFAKALADRFIKNEC